ncbi:lipopolysaccharide biosynthesis protein [Mangrovibacterium diazotrophicum]|uniref:O-antigen/teichoic acid export membrane protein n=1 Tax=Mangrovibacterium diazotrophicum TaxID=1261403 RepID=A0A419W5P1_9BACT|nr:oligosaccharide flippase family protein [Mangrovibacterium diazotrophicum]RKD90772.1 O-antigen/teichoic acid export membrane protein [Mangrovibacterium diazotrophicum]
MKNKQITYFANSFIWGVVAKIIDALIKFATIPLLLNYFGDENYGLLTLAIATNAYIQLLDLGMNTGAVKFFSQWIVKKEYDLIDRVARTNYTFYLIIGLINASILICLATIGADIFKISLDQFHIFQKLLLIMALFSLFNWVTFVFNQLLIADEKIAYTQKWLSIKAIANLIIVFLTLKLKLSLIQYFTLFCFINIILFLPYYITCKKNQLLKSLIPGFHWKEFSAVFRYSMAIFAMSLFQFTATQSRPLVLGMFSKEGLSILAEYRIIEVFPIFIISIGGILISILLPKTAKAIEEKNKKEVERIAYQGTKYTSIIVILLCLPIILNSTEIIRLYVGDSYTNLSVWLSIWVATITLFLHGSPSASLVLATGKTRMLVYSSAIACTVSIILNALLCSYYGVGSAVIGYLVYIVIQMAFYYFYFNHKILELNSLKVFKSFVIPTSIGFAALGCVWMLNIQLPNLYLQVASKSLIWFAVFAAILHFTKTLRVDQLVTIISRTKE